MATVKIETFGGLMPRFDASLIPANCALVANNLLLKSGKIDPLRAPSEVSFAGVYLENGLSSIQDAKTIYAWRRTVAGNVVTTILAWPGIVHVAPSNLADDDRDRIFVTGQTGIPHQTGIQNNNQPAVYFSDRNTGTVIRRTLVKTAPGKPVVSLADGLVPDPNNTRYTVFYQTWVDKYGYESPHSPASDEIAYTDGQTVVLAATTKPDGQACKRRIYKTITGNNTEDNRFIAEFDDASAWGQKEITVSDADAGETMPEIESPAVDLRSVLYVPGGFYVGHTNALPKTVMFSDAQMPYSWPVEYQYDIHDRIVGMATSKNTVYVMTDNRVWILRGSYPDTMVASMLSPAACVSERSIVQYGNNVFFASNFGLCMVTNSATDGDVVLNLTDKFFTKEQWLSLNPETCIACQIDGRILAFFTVNGEQKGYIFDLNEKECLLTTHDEKASVMCVQPETDKMIYVGGGS